MNYGLQIISNFCDLEITLVSTTFYFNTCTLLSTLRVESFPLTFRENQLIFIAIII